MHLSVLLQMNPLTQFEPPKRKGVHFYQNKRSLPSIIDNLDFVTKKPVTTGFFGTLSIVSKYAAAVDFLGRFRCFA